MDTPWVILSFCCQDSMMEIKHILISQPNPNGSSPYVEVQDKFHLNVDFIPFIKVQGVSARDFRAQRITILDHTAIVFTSRMAIDSFFHLCEELRVTVPEDMKYFCMTEAIAFYLQKYIVYRKRKISYGKGNVASLLEAIGNKHKNEKFLLAMADTFKPEFPEAFEKAGLSYTKGIFLHTVCEDLTKVDLSKYQMLVFYSPSDVKSLFENYPNFEQGDTLFATFGPATAQALKEAHLHSCFEAPTPEAPSIAKALSIYLEGLAKKQ